MRTSILIVCLLFIGISHAQTDTLANPVKTPVVFPPSQSFSDSLRVTITCDTPADVIMYYTLDGVYPRYTESGDTKIYRSPILITATTTVKVIAVSARFNAVSEEGFGIYTKASTSLKIQPSKIPDKNKFAEYSDFLGRIVQHRENR